MFLCFCVSMFLCFCVRLLRASIHAYAPTSAQSFSLAYPIDAAVGAAWSSWSWSWRRLGSRHPYSIPWNWKVEQLELELETNGLKTPLVNSLLLQLKELELDTMWTLGCNVLVVSSPSLETLRVEVRKRNRVKELVGLIRMQGRHHVLRSLWSLNHCIEPTSLVVEVRSVCAMV